LHNISHSKIGIVHLGINLEQFKPVSVKNSSHDFFTIGYVGRIINEYKGVDYIPFVAKYLKEEHKIKFRMIIAGDGPDRIKVEKLCKELGVENSFCFLGWVEDVNKFLNDIDLLIVPSRHESLGLTALEGLAVNVPVLAFDVQGLRETLKDCPAGKLIKPGDTKAMAEAVYSLRNKHSKLGRKGREFVEGRFSNKQMAKRYEEMYGKF
jgi:L-malate glycosyltransferase